jgi:hypothetical protein
MRGMDFLIRVYSSRKLRLSGKPIMVFQGFDASQNYTEQQKNPFPSSEEINNSL